MTILPRWYVRTYAVRLYWSPDACLVDSDVEGPVIIGERCEVISSRIGPFTSIQSGVGLWNTEIEDSIVLQRAEIEGSGLLRGSLIGRDVRISGVRVPGGISLLLGDDCKVTA